jgi:Dyp-type peroxidase family
MLDLDDIQGLVFSGYARQPYARFWLLNLGETGAAAWLSRVLPRVSTSERRERRGNRRLNLAFTASGLRTLGLPDTALATFPATFLRGAGAAANFGGAAGARLDALVLGYAATENELDTLSDEVEDDFERFGFEARVEDVYLPSDGREHFGFVDARTNPRVRGGPRRRHKNPFDLDVPAGEFVLGYRNAYGHFAKSPHAPVRTSARPLPHLIDARRAMDLGQNGTFVAVRKFAQDVPGFWRFAARAGGELWPEAHEHAAARFAAQLVGRTLDGVPLALPSEPHRPAGSETDVFRSLNRFGYRGQAEPAARCPFGAHIRRANPRDGLGDDAALSLAAAQKHRLIRRSRLYGDKLAPGEQGDGRERGLFFMALCADLERQFEFVHDEWLGNPKLGGLTHERDPLLPWTPLSGSDHEPETFSIAEAPFRRTVSLERFVSVRGSAYLFMPGLRALAYLAEG